jgi:FPC/CPF motif-containing protein YcgG
MLLVRRGGALIDSATGNHAVGKEQVIAQHLVNHIEFKRFPCPMGKTAVANNAFNVGIYDTMCEDAVTKALYRDIKEWLEAPYEGGYRTFLVGFSAHISDHDYYHNQLFKLLWKLRQLEPGVRDIPDGVSDDIASADYAFSIHGQAFFVVGLSPTSPRLSRRTAYAGFALNLHSQFEKMRIDGKMVAMQNIVRKRDILLHGGINPQLATHGQASAALQYSAKEVISTDQCPFHNR